MQVLFRFGFHAHAELQSGATAWQKAQTPAETPGDELQVDPVTTCPNTTLSL